MSRDASVTLDFVDGPHEFRLGWGELVKLQETCDAGPYVIYQRLMLGQWRMQDISATIRLGLVGGGMKPEEALRMVQGNVETRPPLESLPLAQGILGIALQGAPDEKPGEAEGEATGSGSTTSPTESSGPASSTAGSPQSGASPTRPTD
jgi:hypothetical protein